MAKVIGIDLGTTNSCMAYVENDGAFKVINLKSGANTMPSVVAFDKSGQRLVGDVAKRQMQTNSENVFYETKRLIGKRYSEAADLIKNLSYKIVASDNGDAWVESKGVKYSPSQVASFVLSELKERAKEFFGHDVKQAVITVPAYFNDAQRQATKDAGAIAGLEVLRIINEPTAAALAYGLEKNKSGKVVVYDLGGGTFDVSVLDIADGVFEVLATGGDTNLGGGNFDEKIMEFLIAEFKSQNPGVVIDKMATQRLKDAAENAKKDLSSSLQTEINLPFLSSDAMGPKHLNITLSRAKLEEMTASLIQRTIDPCKQALKDSGLSASEISEVVMVGGMTRMPKVIEEVKKFFGKEPHQGVNPDEVVAVGAAIQGAILSGDFKEGSLNDIVLLDVTPLTLGIETQGGIMTPIIEKNTTIPTKKSQVFSTAEDNQPAVQIKVYQGERQIAAHNKLLGEFHLDGIMPARRGTPQIEVTFDMDSNGILHVSALDKGTNKSHNITITSSGGLSKEEIEKMINEAKLHEESDKLRKDLVQKKYEADSLISTVEKGLTDHGEKLSSEEKELIETALNNLKTVKDTEDLSILTQAFDDLTQKSMKLGEILYNETKNSETNNPVDKKDEDLNQS